MRKKIYQCSKKNVTTIIGAPAKNGQGGGGARTKIPRTYGENGLYVERRLPT